VTLTLTSSAFEDGAALPGEYTCDGADRSPPLAWNGVPPKTRSLALICDDPDAPGKTFVHWVLYEIAPGTTTLAPGIPPSETLAEPVGALQGTTDFRRVGYGGPCPPPGKPHRYFFRLHALDTVLNLPPGIHRPELEAAMAGHVLAVGTLMGTYQRHRGKGRAA
jgi:Raf kinase inhibitor-like YbhB/YbcL family protein